MRSSGKLDQIEKCLRAQADRIYSQQNLSVVAHPTSADRRRVRTARNRGELTSFGDAPLGI